MVAPFMFYSGYGVMESIKRKGSGYVKSFPKKRVLKTLINFDFAIILFLILNVILSKTVTLKQLVLSFIGWDSIGNSNWYIFIILVLYLFTFIAFAVLPQKPHIISVVFVGLLTCGMIVILWKFNIKDPYWYDTALCYILGLGYSLVKEKVQKVINKNIIVWGVFLVLTTVIYINLKGRNLILEIAANLMFTIALVIFSMRITLKNKALVWCGMNLFELYILQRIPMIMFNALGFSQFNIYLYFVCCIITTVILAFCFKRFTNMFWKKLKL